MTKPSATKSKEDTVNTLELTRDTFTVVKNNTVQKHILIRKSQKNKRRGQNKKRRSFKSKRRRKKKKERRRKRKRKTWTRLWFTKESGETGINGNTHLPKAGQLVVPGQDLKKPQATVMTLLLMLFSSCIVTLKTGNHKNTATLTLDCGVLGMLLSYAQKDPSLTPWI